MATLKKIQIKYKNKNIEDYNIFISNFQDVYNSPYSDTCKHFTHVLYASCRDYEFYIKNGKIEKHDFLFNNIIDLQIDIAGSCTNLVFAANLVANFKHDVFTIKD